MTVELCQKPIVGQPIPVDTTAQDSTPGTGAGVSVALIDTGSAAPGVTGDRDSCIVHGTAVASALHSVAPNAAITSLRHSDKPEQMEGTVANLVAAMDKAISEPINAKVLNISMVACQDTVELRDAVKRAQDAGALVVASTGNTGQCHEDQIPYPAALPGVVAVGAVDGTSTDFNDIGRIPATFSAPGPWATLFASGGPVSARLELEPGNTSTIVGSPEPFVGTSFATPIVAGTAARIWEILPHATADEIAEILQETATPGGSVEGMTEPIRVVDTQAAVNAAVSLAHVSTSASPTKSSSTSSAYAPVQTVEASVMAQPITAMPPSYVVPLSLALVFSVVFVAAVVRRAFVSLK